MSESVVVADAGAFRGIASDAAHAFLGIQYGTLEGRRFREGLRIPRHEGVRDSLTYGPVAMQFDSRLLPAAHSTGPASLYFPNGGQQSEGRPMSEECLTLNIWTPETDREARLPVVVWVHGGAFRAGSAAATVTNGARLAARGRAVVVSVAHRLGAFGFMPLADLLGEEYRFSGVAGLTDIALALEWIADNISAFGGDPGRITLVGQSGGGNKIHALLSSSRAAAYISGVILQSPAGPGMLSDSNAAHSDRELLLDALELSPDNAREIVTVSAHALTLAQGRINASGSMGPVPVADGEFIDPRRTAEISGTVPTLVGHTSHDFSFFLAGEAWFRELDSLPRPRSVEVLIANLAPVVGSRERATELTLALAERYPAEPPTLLAGRVATEVTFAAGADAITHERAAMSAPVYRYEFNHGVEGSTAPLGATHCVDVPFVFDSVDWSPIAGESDGRFTLAQRVGDTWLAFAEGGDPSTPRTAWLPFTSGSPRCMHIGPGDWTSNDRDT